MKMVGPGLSIPGLKVGDLGSQPVQQPTGYLTSKVPLNKGRKATLESLGVADTYHHHQSSSTLS